MTMTNDEALCREACDKAVIKYVNEPNFHGRSIEAIYQRAWDDCTAYINTRPSASVNQEIIGLLEPIAECNWHGKWRINKAIDRAKSLEGE